MQGTGAVAFAGMMGALRASGHSAAGMPAALAAQRFVVAGAGSAGMGVCGALRDGIVATGGAPTAEAAARQFFVCDVDGLIARDGCSDAEWQAPP